MIRSKKSQHHKYMLSITNEGFTLVELVLIIILLGILSVTAYVKWPTGLDNRAAIMEMKRAIRHTQHIAMTRAYNVSDIWRLRIENNMYTITNNPLGDSGLVPAEFVNRRLLGSSSTTINNGVTTNFYFNGLGEPVDNSGFPEAFTQTLSVNGSISIAICPQTGFVKEGSTCP